MGNYIYCGLPEWRKLDYLPQIEILKEIFSKDEKTDEPEFVKLYDSFD